MLEQLQQGMSIHSVCKAHGVHRNLFYEWRAKGEAGEEPYVSFFEELARVRGLIEGECVARCLEIMRQDKDKKTALQALIWYYDRVLGHQLDGRNGANPNVDGEEASGTKVIVEFTDGTAAEAESAAVEGAPQPS